MGISREDLAKLALEAGHPFPECWKVALHQAHHAVIDNRYLMREMEGGATSDVDVSIDDPAVVNLAENAMILLSKEGLLGL